MAVNRKYKDKNGELKEETCFVTAVVWDKQAESCNQYLSKGRPVFIEGRLQSRTWDTPEGQKRSVLEVRAERVQFLGSASQSAAAAVKVPSASESEAESPFGNNVSSGNAASTDEDITF